MSSPLQKIRNSGFSRNSRAGWRKKTSFLRQIFGQSRSYLHALVGIENQTLDFQGMNSKHFSQNFTIFGEIVFLTRPLLNIRNSSFSHDRYLPVRIFWAIIIPHFRREGYLRLLVKIHFYCFAILRERGMKRKRKGKISPFSQHYRKTLEMDLI